MASYGLYVGLLVSSLVAATFFVLILVEVEIQLMAIIGIVITALISGIFIYLMWQKSKQSSTNDRQKFLDRYDLSLIDENLSGDHQYVPNSYIQSENTVNMY